MKEYIEYNTKQGITDLLSEIELDDEKGWVEGMHKGEMIASIKFPEKDILSLKREKSSPAQLLREASG